VDLASFGNRGLKIDGENSGHQIGATVDGAGDVNGDGLTDIVFTSGSIVPATKDAWVVFGRRARGTVNAGSLGSGGYRVDCSGCGIFAAVGLGDINGDRRSDLAFADPSQGSGAGRVYVQHGKASGTPTDAATATAYKIDGPGAGAPNAGFALEGVGDINGDRRPDLALGAPLEDHPGATDAGSVYVVFGKPAGGDVALDSLGTGGYEIRGETTDDRVGISVAGGGDVNGDGRPDVVAGAPAAQRDGVPNAGAAYVVFGKPNVLPIELGGLGTGGFEIKGASGAHELGLSTAIAGDVTGDGRADVAVSAGKAGFNGRATSGSVHLVRGRASGDVDIGNAPSSYGYRVDGAASGDELGGSRAGLQLGDATAGGDVNGDLRPDLLVGGLGADNNARNESGSAYAILGFGQPALGYGSLRTRVGANVVHPPFIVRRTHTAVYSLEGSLPAGLSLNRATGMISGTPTAGAPDRPYGIRITDAAGSASTLVRIHVVSAPRPPACTNRIRGTNRRNTLRGTDLGDNMFGLRGNDRLFGGAGDDCLRGGKGNDRLSAGPGRDRLRGESGNDTLLGSSGNDAVNGGSGKDRANGGVGRDTYTMGSGNDRITTADGVSERVNCGSGRDRVVAADRGDRLRSCERVRRN
jgi:hypothetical protein